LRQYIKEIGKHSTIYTISNILTKAIGIILIPIYTRFLTVEDYGIISIVAPIVNAFLIIYTFGMRATYGRFFFDHKDRSREQKKTLGTIVIFVLALGLFGNILFTFFGESLFNRVFPGVDFYPYILLGIWTGFFLLTFDMKMNIFRLRQQSLAYGIYSILKFASIVILTILMVVSLKMGALGKILSEFIICAAFFVLSFILIIKDIIFAFDVKKFKELLKYALPVLPHNLAGVIIALTAKYFLNINDGIEAAGIYNIAFLIGSIMNIVVSSINLTWNPFFMKTAQAKEEGEAKKIFAQLTSYYVMAVIFLGMVIAFFAEEAISILTTPDYYAAVAIAPIIVFAYVIQGGYYILITKIFYVKKATWYLPVISVSAAITNIIFNAILVPRFGLAGSAWSFLVTTLFLITVTYFISQRVYPITYEYKRIISILLLSSLCIIAYLFIMDRDPGMLFAIVLKLLILLVYLVSFFIFKLIRREEVDNLKDIYQKVLKRYVKKE